MNKEIIKLGITLMIVTMVATIALSLTNEITKDKIKEQKEIQLLYSLAEIIPEADDFNDMDTYYDALKNEKSIGKILKINTPGYASTIELLAGVDSREMITKIVVLNQVETPGLGAYIENQDFLDQFIGKSFDELQIKKDGGKIDAITGATISSRAVANGIREELKPDSVTGATPDQIDETTGATPKIEDDEYEDKEEGENEDYDDDHDDDEYEDKEDDDNEVTGAAVYTQYLNKKLAENEAK